MPSTKTLPPFNNSKPLQVVILEDGYDAKGLPRMGIIDESRLLVWKEHDLAPSRVYPFRQLLKVALPCFPELYGSWLHTSIGGISATVRRVGLVNPIPLGTDPITIFAINAPVANAFDNVFLEECHAGIKVMDSIYNETHGHVTELRVAPFQDISHVAAMIVQLGATPIVQGYPAKRSIGIERLDRIGAEIVTTKQMVRESDEIYGLRRGCWNWNFGWLPQGWTVPITWDHMVQNVYKTAVLADLSQPLLQHVAKYLLKNQPTIGGKWIQTNLSPLAEELSWNVKEEPPYPLRKLITLDTSDQERVLMGMYTLQPSTNMHTLTQIQGEWYRPYNSTQQFLKHIPSKRYVSAALSAAQSKQLIESFYFVNILQTQDPLVQKAFGLILYQYMKEKGYTARWMGKYDQGACHIGNGDSFRVFQNLEQYNPHTLPVNVLNKLCGLDGKLINKGSKGSRSKYRQSNKDVYVPGRRLKRTRDDEQKMVRR